MLKRSIKYVDFDDNPQEEIAYFNLSKTELVELEAGEEGVSFSARMERIVESKDAGVIVAEIKKLILLAYGEKSMDGKHFIKNDELRARFAQSAPFDALFMELAQDANAAVEFLRGCLPKDFSAEYDKAVKDGRIQGVPKERTPGLPTKEEFDSAQEERGGN